MDKILGLDIYAPNNSYKNDEIIISYVILVSNNGESRTLCEEGLNSI